MGGGRGGGGGGVAYLFTYLSIDLSVWLSVFYLVSPLHGTSEVFIQFCASHELKTEHFTEETNLVVFLVFLKRTSIECMLTCVRKCVRLCI